MISKTSLRIIAFVQKQSNILHVNPMVIQIFALKYWPIISCTLAYVPHGRRVKRETGVKVQITLRLLFVVWLIQHMALNPFLRPVDIMLGVLILSPVLLSAVILHVTYFQNDSVEFLQLLRRFFQLDKYLGNCESISTAT
jgi:hypothetical protein